MTLTDIDAAEYATPAAQESKELRDYDHILFETAHVRRDGTTVPIELSSRAIEYDGKPAVLSIARDITERKRMEQYILRTERLAAMGHLAAAMAHEINNPLQSIGSSMELVMDFPLEEEERLGYLEAVQSEVKRLGAITNRVLDFARPPQVEHRPIWLSEVVRYALTLTGKQLQHSRIQASLDLPDESPRVVGSRDRLAQVFLNLIINAIEAMPDGGELEIAARTVENQVELTFSDSGPGIPSHTWHTIFEPFYTTKEEGTGLGLAISYSIVQDHGGTITASNAALGGAKIAVGSAKTAVGGAKIAVTLPLAPSSTS
jgi:two-component system sporulation sensor kinase A